MSPYAAGTVVPEDRSRAEIERTLRRYGADQFMYGVSDQGSFVMFRAHGRVVRFVVPPPDPEAPEVMRTATGRVRASHSAARLLEGEGRRRWRALLLAIKAKLEAVASGIAVFEQEFLSYTVLANNRTVYEHLGPAVAKGLEDKALPSFPRLTATERPAS